ncbi:DNA gyrase subunit A [Candidatus Shapirobacteria bacterium RIFOXYD1_FULL_38_32]|uniref:DNA gyrase subunit A n=1 Tax=Candidatus Shapirobacteria bacterium RIFOXYB1_FULL_38_38 TaxID=1802151 RepID=A0A1F7SVI7_9BACT|nr:MAG: DNA gyrase subunit A [Candidatus Shapirobacteria bacterium RIFOXYA1_FULL_39_17]OGL57428.1 MAG: DNA gyrase subunit A [Candidatus Shapirobacteria bacterium RIFOXYC1_FULL_38_24]OGL57810.1 MAG: DNA gyrase subunit A [Candidatus Shapirobacteria bacterium RIFOXYB1_FULL_38_38]OGL57846.1 MAG: DNA gyrase subunit A [Candidatus Shapirobacteria bacterium RIFOXYD1_FULL_38_32]HAP37666.1 DNA gyrase subunit A [Candidatus Shapirobacteria bacterium]
MSEDNNNTSINKAVHIENVGKVFNIDIVPEMERSYLDYAMSVIVQRALPDVRDGLKPVHRRIIFAMNQMGLSGSRNSKSAKVVGEVLGKYHPHGDMSVYMAMVRMAQEFSLRYPLVKGQGNFGSIDGDPPAAMRYTEVRMDKISQETIADINKETVDMTDNFDGTLKEPSVLPSRIPTLLLNGADGIAVGMATKIPPHNLKELCQAIDHILDNSQLELVKSEDLIDIKPILKTVSTTDIVLKDIYELEKKTFNLDTTSTVEDLAKFVQGPDFPTSGEIYGKTGIIEMYNTGRGKFAIRGKTNIEETRSGKVRIVITEIPYQVNKAELVKKIADLVRDKKIIGISDLRDESDRHGIRVVVEIKKNGRPKSILNKLFKYTSLQSSYSANILALVNGVPQTLNLRQMLLLFLRHRENIVRRRTIFDLKGAKMRSHILEGLHKALDILDQVIATIRASADADDARNNLMSKFGFTDLQANAILEMQLRKLAALERQKIEDEFNEIKKIIEDLTSIITKPAVMIKVLKDENKEITDKYSDPRRTKIYIRGLENFTEEDLIANERTLVTITKTGYVKRVSKETYRSQNRGGKGVVGMATKDTDEIENILSVNTHDDLLFFTNKGKVFKTKVWELNESSRQSKGQAIINLINIDQNESVQAVLPIGKDNEAKHILLATKNGVVKKTSINQFKNIRQSGLTAIKLDPKDELVWAKLTSGNDQIFLVTHNGKCIRFSEKDTRPMGRHTRGVRGILLKENDYLVSMDVIPEKLETSQKSDNKSFRHLLVVTEKGIGKRTDVYQYPIQKRGGVGVKASNLSDKTGKISVAQVVSEIHDQIILVSKKAVTIKLPLKNIPILNRNTKGVILMRLKSNEDSVTALTIIELIQQ